jgi:uroporphyrin-III C-methyltransferase/precorrin-2 dehydrogenase/sirohydrochlorin ferrochelatase
MFYLPLFHALQGRPCLVIGAGTTARRKIKWLLRAGAHITVRAQNAHPAIVELAATGQLELTVGDYDDHQIRQDLALVVCATNDDAVSQRAYTRAISQNVLINCVDRPDLCTVIFPSIVDRFPILIAISSMGSAPTLARVVRGWIVKTKLPTVDARKRFWERAFVSHAADLAIQGQVSQAEVEITSQLETYDEQTSKGSIALVGAGPGDPELITLKGLRLLQTADVVLYDNLANPALLEFARRDAEQIFVGKQGPKPNDPPDRPKRYNQQDAITAHMLEMAIAGKCVVRLKGGDPFIYGRGGEELRAALDAGIDIQIVPGITAALGAASYAGIPLTHRNVSQSVRFVTGHRMDDDVNLNWPEMAQTEQTLVIYMGLVGLEKILSKLVDAGRDASSPAVLVENATLPQQRTVYGNIGTLAMLARQQDIDGPTTAIIGDVVGLFAPAGTYQD